MQATTQTKIGGMLLDIAFPAPTTESVSAASLVTCVQSQMLPVLPDDRPIQGASKSSPGYFAHFYLIQPCVYICYFAQSDNGHTLLIFDS